MGLDQYLFAKKNGDVEEICYWRKHANLQGLMQNIAVEKGIVKNVEEFNCMDLPLDSADLIQIKKAIKSNNLPHTTGFFFGSSRGDELEQDLIAFDDAESYLKIGWEVFYNCWW